MGGFNLFIFEMEMFSGKVKATTWVYVKWI